MDGTGRSNGTMNQASGAVQATAAEWETEYSRLQARGKKTYACCRMPRTKLEKEELNRREIERKGEARKQVIAGDEDRKKREEAMGVPAIRSVPDGLRSDRLLRPLACFSRTKRKLTSLPRSEECSIIWSTGTVIKLSEI